MQALIGLVNETALVLRAQLPFPLFPATTITATAAAVAVALGAGGRISLALYVAYVALGIALAIPGVLAFCDRSGGAFPQPDPDRCTPVGFLASLWPQVIGFGFGLAVARILATRGSGTNSALRVAGALAVAQFAILGTWGAIASPAIDTATNTLAIAGGFAASAVAAGVIAAQLRRGVRNAAIVAAIWLLPWVVTQVPFASRLTGPIPPENVAPIVATIVVMPISAALLVLTAAVTARSRFVPRGLRSIDA